MGGIAGGFLLIIAAVLLVLYRNWKYEQELDSLLWKVNYKDIQIKEQKDDSAGVNEAPAKCNSKVNARLATSFVFFSSMPSCPLLFPSISSDPNWDFPSFDSAITLSDVERCGGNFYSIPTILTESFLSRKITSPWIVFRNESTFFDFPPWSGGSFDKFLLDRKMIHSTD